MMKTLARRINCKIDSEIARRLLVIWIALSPHLVWAASIDTILKNNKALKELSNERKAEAYDILSNTLVEHPQEPVLNYNLGQIFESNEEKDKAFQLYQSASKNSEEPELKFNALFNAARMAGELKQRDQALQLYQQALEINPDSVETKTNIELLMANSGGGGEGENKEQKKDDQGQDKDKQKQPQEPKPDQDKKDEPKSKPKPQPFQSKELNQQDVKKILDELKRQEEGVRAKFNDKRRQESPVEKDW